MNRYIYTMPAPNHEVIPTYVDIATQPVFDTRKELTDEVVTGFTLFKNQDQNPLVNHTVVARPQEAFPDKLDGTPFLAVLACTAVGLDKDQTLEAYDVGPDTRHLAVLEALYKNLGLDDLSNKEPGQWPAAVAVLRTAYARQLLQIKNPIHISLPNRDTRLRAEKQAEMVLTANRILTDDFKLAMLGLSSRFQALPLSAYAISKTTNWRVTNRKRSASAHPGYRNPLPELMARIKDEGVPTTAILRGATFTYNADSSLDEIQNESLAMTAFGLARNDMPEVSQRYSQHLITPWQVIDDICKNHLHLEEKVNDVALSTILVRDGYVDIVPGEGIQPPQFPDTPLHNAIIALIPSGMGHKDIFRIITKLVPELADISNNDYTAAKKGLFHEVHVTGLRDFNTALLAYGLTDRQDLHDVDVNNPDGNADRLRRKLDLS